MASFVIQLTTFAKENGELEIPGSPFSYSNDIFEFVITS